MHFVCGELRPADALSLVSFSEVATVDLPPTRMTAEGRVAAKAAVNRLFPGGGTDLSRGLVSGLEQLAASPGGVRGSVGCVAFTQGFMGVPTLLLSLHVYSIVLLTDGLDDGETIPRHRYAQRYGAVLAAARQANVPVFCLGFGKEVSARVEDAWIQA